MICRVVSELEKVGFVGNGKVQEGGLADPIAPGVGGLPDLVPLPVQLEPDRPDLPSGLEYGRYPDVACSDCHGSPQLPVNADHLVMISRTCC